MQDCRPHFKFSRYCQLSPKEVLPAFTPSSCFWGLQFPCIVDILFILRHFCSSQSNVLKSYHISLISSFLNCHIFLAVYEFNHSPTDGHSAWFSSVCPSVSGIAHSAARRNLHKHLDALVLSSLSHLVPELTLLGQSSSFILRNTNKSPFPQFYANFWCNFPVACVYLWHTWSCRSFIFLTI